ncbi:phage major capsid protein [Paraburkholderia antibiotica]|uniref:Phage major capsid protein n=1 Tax=Paraburkholderia antibiotica TaxID=2728839 RepID=A0A7X9ZV06_9BURK|nr:phage major capsid protein [Paraburkholderia antibiotica]NML29392.1 phage major capsid protein [Paraburkholderia antibiotica]
MDMSEMKQMVMQAFADRDKAMTERMQGIETNLLDLGQKYGGIDEGRRIGSGARGTSLGALAAKSNLLTQWAGGNGPRTVRAAFDDYDLKADLAPVTNQTFPGQAQQILVPPLVLPRFWSSLVSLPTTASAVQAIGGELANNADYQYPEGTLKAQSTLGLTDTLFPVCTIAHWIIASKQVLDDEPALQSFIDVQMREGLQTKVDAEVLDGNGAPGHLTGLITAGTALDGAGGDNKLDTILIAVATLVAQGATRVVVGLNPLDVIGMATMKDASGAYLMNPLVPLAGVLGATFVPVAAIPQGSYVAAATPQGAYIALRQGVVLEISREDADNFRRNLVTILTETRLAVVVANPTLVLRGGFSAATTVGTATHAGKSK